MVGKEMLLKTKTPSFTAFKSVCNAPEIPRPLWHGGWWWINPFYLVPLNFRQTRKCRQWLMSFPVDLILWSFRPSPPLPPVLVEMMTWLMVCILKQPRDSIVYSESRLLSFHVIASTTTRTQRRTATEEVSSRQHSSGSVPGRSWNFECSHYYQWVWQINYSNGMNTLLLAVVRCRHYFPPGWLIYLLLHSEPTDTGQREREANVVDVPGGGWGCARMLGNLFLPN